MPNQDSATIYDHMRTAWAALTAVGAPFEVGRTSVRGQALKTYVSAPASLRDIWLSSAQFAQQDYLVYQNERWTYEDAHQQVAAIANWLVANGVGPGDRVALAMRNYPEWLLCYWATLAVGAASVGMNAWWVGPEMVYGLEDAARLGGSR